MFGRISFNRKYWYLLSVVIFFLIYGGFSIINFDLVSVIFNDWWPVSITMILGSFVAGSTSLGGGAIAFPVLSKILMVDAVTAKQFSLFIQSVGMGLAAIAIISVKTPDYRWFFRHYLVGSLLGLSLGLIFLQFNLTLLKILMTSLFIVFGVSYSIALLSKKRASFLHRTRYKDELFLQFLLGIFAGVITSQLGSGADVLLFMIGVLRYRLPLKILVPTTVVIMAINAIWGSLMIVLLGQLNPDVIHMWIAAMPIVAIGAPLGTWFMRQVNQEVILGLTYALIGLECLTTILRLSLVKEELYFFIVSFFVSVALTIFLKRGLIIDLKGRDT